jgi:hypothetical protein
MAQPPKVSPTTDNRTHHTSPNSGPQKPQPAPPPKNVRKIGSTSSFKLPEPLTKHPNRVGRPKTPRG